MTADGGSTRAHMCVWTEPHQWEPSGILAEMAKSRSGAGKAFAVLL